MKVLVKLFQKLAQVEGAKPSSPSAEGEILLRRFSFCQAFSFAPIWSKEKAGKRFWCVAGYRSKNSSPTFFFVSRRRKEKSSQKRNAV